LCQESFLPFDYRSANVAKKPLLINLKSDTVIPRANALRLKADYPASTQIWLPLGHYSSIVHLFWMPRWVSKRLRNALS
jgi:hypothetical protein